MDTNSTTTLQAAEGYERVDAFERPATFIAKKNRVHLLDVQSSDGPAPCFTLHETDSDASDIAVMHRDGGFFVGYEKSFFQFNSDGLLVETIDLQQICDDMPLGEDMEGYEEAPREGVNWRIVASESDRQLYFSWLTKGKKGNHVGRLDLDEQRVDWLAVKFGFGLAFDTERDLVYEAWAHEEPGIYVRRFDEPTASPKHWPTQGSYIHATWSPDVDRLLLSRAALQGSSSPLAVIDTDTGAERNLAFTGTDAAWGADGRIWFYGQLNSLWVAAGPDAEPKRILCSDSKTTGGFHSPPVLSSNGEWVAWSFVDRDEPRLVLLDTVTRTYRVLGDFWPNCAWLV